jgi:hypothetical protein
MSICLVILRKYRAESPVDETEHHGVGHNLREATGTGRKGEKYARGEEDEKDDGDEDIRIKTGHLSIVV